MEIKGYKEVTYNQLQSLITKNKEGNKSDVEIAVALKVETTQTVRNAMQKDEQKVSDKILSLLLCIVGIDGFVLWNNGVRSYYVTNNLKK